MKIEIATMHFLLYRTGAVVRLLPLLVAVGIELPLVKQLFRF